MTVSTNVDTSTPTDHRIGLLTSGRKGRLLAERLVARGWAPITWSLVDIQPGRVREAIAADDVQLPDARYVVLALSGDQDLQDLLHAEEEVLAGWVMGKTVLNTTVADPLTAERLGGQVETAGGRYLECQVVGQPDRDTQGWPAVLLGVSKGRHEEALDIVSDISTAIHFCGSPRSAMETHLSFLLTATTTKLAIAEGFRLAERSSANLASLRRLLVNGAFGSSLAADTLAEMTGTDRKALERRSDMSTMLEEARLAMSLVRSYAMWAPEGATAEFVLEQFVRTYGFGARFPGPPDALDALEDPDSPQP